MDWPTALAIFLPPFAALAGVIVGARMSRSTQREALIFEARQKRFERMEAAAGEIRAILLDSDPQHVSMNFHPQRSASLLEQLQLRWQAVRPEILGAAVMESDNELRTAMAELARDVHNSLNSTAWIISDLSTDSEFGHDSINDGRADHASAVQKLDRVSTLLRASSLD